MTAEDVSNATGFVSPQQLLKWERGEQLPRSDRLIDLSRFYNCDPAYLLEDTDDDDGLAAVGARKG